jgi:hypothetical protein
MRSCPLDPGWRDARGNVEVFGNSPSMCWVVGKVNGGGWMSGTLVKSDDQVIRNGYLLLQIKKKTYTAGLTSEWY